MPIIQADGLPDIEVPDDFSQQEIDRIVAREYKKADIAATYKPLTLNPLERGVMAANDAVKAGLTGTGNALNAAGRKVNWAMGVLPAAVADVGEGWGPGVAAVAGGALHGELSPADMARNYGVGEAEASAAQDEAKITGTEQEPGGFRNLAAWWRGAQPSQMPTWQEVSDTPGFAGTMAQVSKGGAELIPKLLITRGLGAAGTAAGLGKLAIPAAGAIAFAPTEQGVSATGAALGAAMPFAQQLGKTAIGAVLAKYGGTQLPTAMQHILEESGGLASIWALNEGISIPANKKLYQEDPAAFWQKMQADTIMNLGFLLLSSPSWQQQSETQRIGGNRAPAAPPQPAPNVNISEADPTGGLVPAEQPEIFPATNERGTEETGPEGQPATGPADGLAFLQDVNRRGRLRLPQIDELNAEAPEVQEILARQAGRITPQNWPQMLEAARLAAKTTAPDAEQTAPEPQPPKTVVGPVTTAPAPEQDKEPIAPPDVPLGIVPDPGVELPLRHDGPGLMDQKGRPVEEYTDESGTKKYGFVQPAVEAPPKAPVAGQVPKAPANGEMLSVNEHRALVEEGTDVASRPYVAQFHRAETPQARFGVIGELGKADLERILETYGWKKTGAKETLVERLEQYKSTLDRLRPFSFDEMLTWGSAKLERELRALSLPAHGNMRYKAGNLAKWVSKSLGFYLNETSSQIHKDAVSAAAREKRPISIKAAKTLGVEQLAENYGYVANPETGMYEFSGPSGIYDVAGEKMVGSTLDRLIAVARTKVEELRAEPAMWSQRKAEAEARVNDQSVPAQTRELDARFLEGVPEDIARHEKWRAEAAEQLAKLEAAKAAGPIKPVDTTTGEAELESNETGTVGQPGAGAPGMDVREPAGTSPRTEPEGATTELPGGQEPASPEVSGPNESGAGNARGPSVRSGEQSDTGAPGRPGDDAGPGAGSGERGGTGSDLSKPGSVKPKPPEREAVASAYERATETFRVASAKFRQVQEDYRAKKIDDTAFMAAQAEFYAASHEFDVAEKMAIQTGETIPIKPGAELGPNDQNHVLPQGEDWIPSGEKAKVRANLDAIALVKRLEAEGRNPTAEEKAVLANYTGWGGLKQVFDSGKAAYRKNPPYHPDQQREAKSWERNWGKLYDEVRSTLTEEEHAAAAKSILNAHYTSREIINGVWKAVQHLGFTGGKALEPAGGIGHFVGLTPEGLRGKTRWTAVELDNISGRILAKLYPQADVRQMGFQDARIAPNSQDLVVSNVPFAKDGPIDKRYPKLSLHNYFFARGLDLLKPGGIMAAITSDSTMDNDASKAAREYMAEKADLVGAIRLPNTAFAKNAGTEVTTDVLFFRKRDGTPFAGEGFVNTQPAETYKGEPIEINEYFAKHPDMMLGRMSLEGTMYGDKQKALLPTPGATLNNQLTEAIARLPEFAFGAQSTAEELATPPSIRAEKGVKIGALILKDGVPYQVQGDGSMEKPEWAGDKKKVAQAQRYIALRDATKGAIGRMLDPNTVEADIAADRASLNKLYDEYVKRHGQINKRSSSFLDDDVEFPMLLALEDGETRLIEGTRKGKAIARRETTWNKARIFSERTLFPRIPPTHVDSVEDGLQVSLNYAGKVDPEYIARLAGVPLERAQKELENSGKAFENPQTGQWENRSTYLSGFVKAKLEAARAAADADPRYKNHVAELQKVQPAPISIENIGLRLGSTWVPPETVQAFIKSLLGLDTKVSFTPETGGWNVHTLWEDRSDNQRNRVTFGVHGWTGTDLIDSSLNLKSAVVMGHETRVSPTTGKSYEADVRDSGKTLEAQEKQRQIEEEFRKFVRSEPEISKRLENIYNENYNGVVSPQFEGPSWDKYPEASADVTLREHQKQVVTRMLQNSTLLAHAVGTGKTYAMVTAAMEMRRLGLARKPMIVVQNATLEQFARSFKRLYPNARVLMPNTKQREEQERNRTMSRIATGDWDAVIIPHSFANMLPDDPVREQGYIKSQVKDLEEAKIRYARDEGKKSPKAADIQRAIDKLQERLAQLLKRPKDNVISFEQTGVDALFVDEAHAYKKLQFSTQMDNIKGLDTSFSQRGFSMFMKARWVQERNQGRNVIFATGTPVSNTIAEAWNMMRYVRPDVLKAYHMEKFDEFASTFGDRETNQEITPGGNWKAVTRFAKYINGPELISAWRTVADVKTAEEVNLPGLPALKNGKTTAIVIPQTEQIAKYVDFLRHRLEWFANLKGMAKRQNSHVPMVTFGLAKKASLDMRMIDPNLPDEPTSKLNRAAAEVSRIYQDSTPVKGTQMVFADSYQDNPKAPRFNLYTDLKAKLVARGIPENEIAIVTSEIKDARREALFAKFNAGDLRVLLGSTERMGIGVNAQEHMIALHHLDAPPRPMDVEQRNGRIVRQGNSNPEVEILSYGVENTLDAAMYQTLARKQRFVNQILRGEVDGRNFEDAANEISLSFEEQMAEFSGDKRTREKVGLDYSVRQLESLRTGHYKQVRDARDELLRLQNEEIPQTEAHLAKAKVTAAEMLAKFGPDAEPRLEGGAVGRKAVNAELDTWFTKLMTEAKGKAKEGATFDANEPPRTSTVTREINGQRMMFQGVVPLEAQTGKALPESAYVRWGFNANSGWEGRSGSGTGFATSLQAAVERVTNQPASYERSLAGKQRNLRELSGFVKQPFEREAELQQARTKLAAIEAELAAEAKAKAPAPVNAAGQTEAGDADESATNENDMAASSGPRPTSRDELVKRYRDQLAATEIPIRPKGDLNHWTKDAERWFDANVDTTELSDKGATQLKNEILRGANIIRSLRKGPETQHSMSGRTSVVKAVVEDWTRFRAATAPQTMGDTARFAGNLLRQLNSKMANEMARADESLKGYRRDFDRTPIPKNWQYDPTLPLPRNLAFIDAYESGDVSRLSVREQEAAAEFSRQNDEWVDRVHALGTGALRTLVENYFPHMWDNPKKAQQLIAQTLNKRPFAGPKAFLKKRTHELFTEALAAGLLPVSDNPVDLWLLKKHEVERYIKAHSFINEAKQAGLLKFVHVFRKAPEGWSTVNDRAFEQYGPPTVTIKEAFDAGMREKTLDVLDHLGVPHERLAKIRGQRWGYEADSGPGTERIVSKFGGPDFVLWHELGHVLDSRYADLREAVMGPESEQRKISGYQMAKKPLPDFLERTAKLNGELRALADLRWEGENPPPSFKRNVRSTAEKMAVILQAYLHAPQRMAKTAPTVMDAFETWMKSHPELAEINEIRPTLRLGEGETEQAVGGLVKLGNYYLPDAAARVVNNYLSPGLNPHGWYRTLRQSSNFLNGVQLGLSGFHLGFTSLDAAVSRLAVGLEDLMHGNFVDSAKTIASSFAAPVTNFRQGARLQREVLNPGSTDTETAALVHALEAGGGRIGQDRFWQTEFTRRMLRAWHEGGLQWGTLPLRVPLAVWEQSMRPILEWIVPKQKLGVFADMARRELTRLGPGADEETLREAMRKAWDSVDNRMGQLVYDNLFYNRAVKDIALLSFRAYGWQLGKYREALGAAYDVAKAGQSIVQRQKPEFTHRMAYAMALPMLVGTLGGIIHYLFTGKRPEGKDYFMPQTGEIDRYGNPVRLNEPSYVKDAISYGKHPVTAFGHSLNPMGSVLMDALQNKDFYDVRIRNPEDPLWQQGTDTAKFAAKQLIPFSVSGALKLREDSAPLWKQVLPFFGFTPVPSRITMTPAQELASELMAEQMPKAPRTQEQADRGKLIAEIVSDLKSGLAEKRAAGGDLLAETAKAGGLTPAIVTTLMDKLKFSPLQFQTHNLDSLAGMRVWRVADPAERAQLLPIMLTKIAYSKTLSFEKQLELGRELTGKQN